MYLRIAFAAVIMMRAFCITWSSAMSMTTLWSTIAAIPKPTTKATKIERLNLALNPII